MAREQANKKDGNRSLKQQGMTKKKKVVSVDSHDETHKGMALSRLCKDYCPDQRNLTIPHVEEFPDAVVQEMLILSLFVTLPGHSILELYYDLSCGRVDLSSYKQWQHSQVRSTDDYKKLVKRWSTSTLVLLRFTDLLLQNKNVPLEYTKHNTAEYKLSLIFLLDKQNEFLILDPDYNLLLDYLLHAKPMIESILLGNIPGLLKALVYQYNKLSEFNGCHTWYTFRTHYHGTQEIFHKFFIALTDKFTASKEIMPELEGWFVEGPVSRDSGCIKPVTGDDYASSAAIDDFNEDYWTQQKIDTQEQVYSFELNEDGSLEIPNVFAHTKRRHDALYKVLGLNDDPTPLLKSCFLTFCCLADPVTQPPPNDKHIVSLDLLSDMFLGLMYPEITADLVQPLNKDTWTLHICFNLQKIINATLSRLNCDDFTRLNEINNSDDSVDWRKNLHKWLPQGLNTQDLELIYMVDILATYTVYKLHNNRPIQMNPFLLPMISLWKNLTCVVLLGLEIDRLEEEQETFNTPVMVRATIRGASALRSVLATIINGHARYKSHDFKHEPINLFMSPHGRKLCNGALYADLRSHAATMLALGVELETLTDLLSDLQPGDRFDEDVKYMFDYEFDDYNEVDTELMADDELEDIESRERIKEMRGYYKRCHCVFDDDSLVPENEDGGGEEGDQEDAKKHLQDSHEDQLPPQQNVVMSTTSKPLAVRSRDTVEFDFNGRDWRDIPRGLNFYYTDAYIFVTKLHADVVHYLMKEATRKKLERNHASFILRSIATCVKLEQEEAIVRRALGNQDGDKGSNATTIKTENELTSDFIYEKWCEDSLFEKMMYHNSDLVWRMMDEMLMCSGYRRVLIWFITHLEINHSVIHYIFELVMGLRGNITYEDDEGKSKNLDALDGLAQGSSTSELTLPFSRQGPIVLSSIEVNMLLQEFFTNAAIFFSSKLRESFDSENEELDENYEDEDEFSVPPHVIGLMKLVCFMVDTLMQKKKFDFTDSEYIFELQTLLMNWIGIVPEARDLFFKLKSQIVATSQDTQEQGTPVKESKKDDIDAPDTLEMDDTMSEHNKKLMMLLPPGTTNERNALTALRGFIGKYSLTNKTAVFGRKIIYQDDEIMGMYMTDKEMMYREFLAEFGIDYNDIVEGVYEEDDDDE